MGSNKYPIVVYTEKFSPTDRPKIDVLVNRRWFFCRWKISLAGTREGCTKRYSIRVDTTYGIKLAYCSWLRFEFTIHR